MNNSSGEPTSSPAEGLSNRTFSIGLPVIFTLVLMVMGAMAGSEVEDRQMLVLVRFIGLLQLIIGLAACVAVGLYCAHSQKRWILGQIAASCTGLSAGFLWSGSAFGAAFAFSMAGLSLGGLLMIKELENRSKRRKFIRKFAK